MRSLTPIELLRPRNRRRKLVDPDRLFAHKPFPRVSDETPPELIEQQRVLVALTVASALAVLVSFGALIALQVFIPA